VAHVEATTELSILLAGVYLKVGYFGYCRYVTQVVADAVATSGPILLGVTIAGLLAGAAHLYFYQDIKRYIATSSIIHVGVGLWTACSISD
jgi:NADH-quinone oxidoreductase subunit M